MKDLTSKLVVEKKREYIESLKAKAVDQKSTSQFYKAVNMFKDAEKPSQWDVRDIF